TRPDVAQVWPGIPPAERRGGPQELSRLTTEELLTIRGGLTSAGTGQENFARTRERRLGRRRRVLRSIDALEPGVLPEQSTPRLTAAVGPTVAAQTLEMYGVPHTPDPCLFDRVARLVRAPEDAKLLTAIGEH